MSTTNRAFIKAYRHDPAKPGGASSAPVNTAGHAPAARVTVGAVEAIGQGPARPLRRSGNLTTEKRPLSSFIPRTQPAIEVASEREQSEAFRPGTKVASFHWPTVCRTLLLQCGPQLDQVTRLMLARADAGNSLIGVLGLFPRIGATTTALCLASRASSRGRRVILGDSNFRSPRVAQWLEAVPTAGWEEVLKHSAPLMDAVIHATDDKLDLLALGSTKNVKDPQRLVGGLQAAVTAGVLRHAYDLALLDLGPFFDPVSQPIVLELISNMGVDAAVAITGPEPADRRDLATIVEHLDRTGCELLGVIENRVGKPKAA